VVEFTAPLEAEDDSCKTLPDDEDEPDMKEVDNLGEKDDGESEGKY